MGCQELPAAHGVGSLRRKEMGEFGTNQSLISDPVGERNLLCEPCFGSGENILQSTAQAIGMCTAMSIATKVRGCLKPPELYGECSE